MTTSSHRTDGRPSIGELVSALSEKFSTLIRDEISLAKAEMAENLAGALGVERDRVNVKATTEEGLGFTGDGSGMAAQAAVLLEKE